ncbi:MAG: serine hydrolase [Bacteroidota bacterium]
MTKSTSRFSTKRLVSILIPVGLLFVGVGYLANAYLPIASSYNAKIMCSCVFVAKRSAEDARASDLKAFQAYVNTEVNQEEQYASASVFGLFERVAAYRPGLGCALLGGRERKAVQARQYQATRTRSLTPASEEINWAPADSLLEGIDQQQIQLTLDKAFSEPDPELLQNTRAVVVLHKGNLIAERYAPAFDQASRLLGWSMSKSVTATLIGMLIKDKRLNLMEAAPVPEWQADERKAITIDHLLRMSDGLGFEENYAAPSNATYMLFREPDAGGYAASVSLAHAPDTKWNYSSGSSNILSRIIRDQFESDDAYYSFVYDSLFARINMQSAVFEPDANGTMVGSSYMYATARDWARFGQLYVQGGEWNGQSLLPDDWATYVSTRTPTAPHGEYGAHFWMNATSSDPDWPMDRQFAGVPPDAYYASGFEGQYVVIIPSLDLVVVRLGLTGDRRAWDLGAFLAGIIQGIPGS